MGGKFIQPKTSLYKRLEGYHEIIISDENDKFIATIIAVSPSASADLNDKSALIATLCSWRNNHLECFFDSTEVTLQSTFLWFSMLTESPERVLFIVYDNTGMPIAQYGLKQISNNSIELDNGILGIRHVLPDLFLKVQTKILDICEYVLEIDEVEAKVLKNNIPALFLHKRCGLIISHVINNKSNDKANIVVLKKRFNSR